MYRVLVVAVTITHPFRSACGFPFQVQRDQDGHVGASMNCSGTRPVKVSSISSKRVETRGYPSTNCTADASIATRRMLVALIRFTGPFFPPNAAAYRAPERSRARNALRWKKLRRLPTSAQHLNLDKRTSDFGPVILFIKTNYNYYI